MPESGPAPERRSPMQAEHARVLSWLRRGSDAPVAHKPGMADVRDMDPRMLEAARQVWTRRMLNEHSSAAVFARLLPQLMGCGAGLEYQTTAMRMAADELHHGALCADVVRALGSKAELPEGIHTRALPTHAGCTPLEVTFRNVLFVGCLAETVAVAFTTEEREQTTDPYVRQVIGQISADEVLHARFGWAFVQDVAPELDADAKARASQWLRIAFRYLEREEMLEVPDVTPPSQSLVEEGMSVGVCDNQATRELFYETVKLSILPGLEALGLAAHDAWHHRHAA